MIYLQLFISFIQVGLFSVGGGYAAVPLIREQVVEAHHWLTVNEFSHLVTIAGMTPGPVSISYFCGDPDRGDRRSDSCYRRLHPALLCDHGMSGICILPLQTGFCFK